MTVAARWLALWLGVCCLTPLTPTVRADDALDARFFDARGRELYARGSFEPALRAFLRAHAIAPSLTTVYNVALTADLAEQPLMAWNSFERFLREAPEDHPLRSEAEARQARLGSSVHVVDVRAAPAGAEVFVDRMEHGRAGRTPVRIALSPGEHVLLVRAERHEPENHAVDGDAGMHTPVHLDLRARLGTLLLSGLPTGGVLALERDDGVVVEARSDGPLPLLVGRYRTTLVAAGFRHEQVMVDIHEGVSHPLVLTPAAGPPRTGRLVVRVSPDATLQVDGIERAQAPVVLRGVDAGPHRVQLSAAGYVPFVAEVDIRANEATRLDVTLTPAPRPAPR